jgi:hypothetical protein
VSHADATAGNGGAGGFAGAGLDAFGSPGAGGAGGTAIADGSATAQNGAASATATARGGPGAAGGLRAASNTPFPNYTGAVAGLPGSATATAEAVAAHGDADAQARAFGGKSNQFAHGQPPGSVSIADSLHTDGAPASAQASAQSDSGNATATAEATGGQAGRADSLQARGGPAAAQAHAVSVSGDATAITRIQSGAASPTYQGPLLSSPTDPGGPGADALSLDAVSGSAGGRLTLIQEVTASGSNSPTLGSGGNADSELHATNPAGGQLHAEVTATGGFGAGDARAIVVATGATRARVEASAHAVNGASGTPVSCGVVQCGLIYGPGGDSDARATAIGHGVVAATANARGINAPAQHAESEVVTIGAISGAHSAVAVSSNGFSPGGIYFPIPDITRSATASAAIGDTAAAPGSSAPAARTGETHIFGAPSAADVASWTAGNPNAIEALTDGHALALGSISTGGGADIALQYSGDLAVDLAASEFGPSEHLALVLLDPAAIGGIDGLHLALTRQGETVFERSFSDAGSALAGLDDAVFHLGQLVGPGEDLTELVLSFNVSLPMSAAYGSFSLDFALLSSPVPEPSTLLLALASTLACVAARARVTARVTRRPA